MISHTKACALIKIKEGSCRNAPNIELLNPRDHMRKVNTIEIENYNKLRLKDKRKDWK